MVHLLDQVSEIVLMIDLWVFEESLIERPDEDQLLAPMDVHRVAHLLLASLTALGLCLMRSVQILLIQALHDVRLEETSQDLTLA